MKETILYLTKMLKLFTATVSLISLTALISSCNLNQANTSGGTMSTTDSPQIQSSMPMTEVQISAMGMDMDLGEADDEFDLRFIDAMIPHHEAAVTMAQDMLNKSQREEMQKLANAIINSQQAEINQLKSWRQEWYGK